MAGSPELLKGFLGATAVFEATDLDPLAREVVVLTVATRNECHLCVAMHTATLTVSTFANRLIEAPLDPPLAAYAWEPVPAPAA